MCDPSVTEPFMEVVGVYSFGAFPGRDCQPPYITYTRPLLQQDTRFATRVVEQQRKQSQDGQLSFGRF